MKKFRTSKNSCFIVSVIAVLCFVVIALVFLATKNIRIETGDYSIQQVVVSNNDEDTEPAVDELVFQPSDTVFCTVKTVGVDGIVGMRWFLGQELISKSIGRTENNTITSYIKSDSPEGLPEGNYHVEVFIVEDKPIETIDFEVKNQSVPYWRSAIMLRVPYLCWAQVLVCGSTSQAATIRSATWADPQP